MFIKISARIMKVDGHAMIISPLDKADLSAVFRPVYLKSCSPLMSRPSRLNTVQELVVDVINKHGDIVPGVR